MLVEQKIQVLSDETSLAYTEAIGLSKCYKAYADYFASEQILEIGFNKLTGYIYIALEFDSVQIASLCGNDVEFIYTDFETGEETFYESFEDYEKERICNFDI